MTRMHVLVLAAVVSAACAAPRPISNSGAGAYEASLTQTASGFAVAWHDDRDGQADIYVRLLDASGRPAGPERRLTSDPELSYEPDIHVAGERLAVAWYDKAADGTLRARLGLWSLAGDALWMRTLSAPGRSGRNPVVRVHGDALFAAWLEDSGTEASEVRAGWWNLDGEAVTPRQWLGPASRTTWNLNAAVDTGGGWVVFDAKVGTRSDELFLARVTSTTADIVRLTEDDGRSSKYPDLVLARDRAALTWFDERDGNQEVYVFVGPQVEVGAAPLDRRARRVTDTPGRSIGAYVAWNGPRLGLAWCDDTEGQPEIYFQPFRIDGAPLADARRLTHNATSSLIPSIRPAGDGFAIAWNEYTPPADEAHAGGTSAIAFTLVR